MGQWIASSNVTPGNYSVQWQGIFNFPAGNYSFFLTASDGIILYIDGSPVKTAWRNQTPSLSVIPPNFNPGEPPHYTRILRANRHGYSSIILAAKLKPKSGRP